MAFIFWYSALLVGRMAIAFKQESY